jgi:hypothetical protein
MEFRKHVPEPVQRGNPYKLVRRQHVFPHASIKRFYGTAGTVTVAFIRENRIVPRLRGTHDLFCANRVWDQRAEAGFMAQIERQFQFLAERILRGDLRWWALEHRIIGAFYALWQQRAHYGANPVPDAELKGVSPWTDMTMDAKEELESKHALYADELCRIPSRQMTSMHIQRASTARFISFETSDGSYAVPKRMRESFSCQTDRAHCISRCRQRWLCLGTWNYLSQTPPQLECSTLRR